MRYADVAVTRAFGVQTLQNNPWIIGVASSLLGAAFFAVIWRSITVGYWRKLAAPFTGQFRMLDREGRPRGGTVTLQFNLKDNLISPAPVIQIFAEHGIGAEDWTGSVEVLGLSNLARGFYRHPNGDGGALQLMLSQDGQRITERGIPTADKQYEPFVRVLERIPRRN